MDHEREQKNLSKIIFILTKELAENKSTSISDIYRYIMRETITPVLASEAAFNDYYSKTGKDIRTLDWRTSHQFISKSGKKFSIHKLYTGDHIQTCKDFKEKLFKAYEEKRLTEDFIEELLKQRYVCWITKDENNRLNALGYKSTRLNPYEAYNEAGIEIYKGNKNINDISVDKTVVKSNAQTQQQLSNIKNKNHILKKCSSITYCSKNTFTFKSEKIDNKERHRNGFATYDNEERLVAVAAMHKDERNVSYGQAELCFFDKYISEFGKWRLVSIEKERLSFEKLKSVLEDRGSFTVTIDPRKGS